MEIKKLAFLGFVAIGLSSNLWGGKWNVSIDYLIGDLDLSIEDIDLPSLNTKVNSSYSFTLSNENSNFNRYEFSYTKYALDWDFVKHTTQSFSMGYSWIWKTEHVNPYINLGLGLALSDISDKEYLEDMIDYAWEFKVGIDIYREIADNLSVKFGYSYILHNYNDDATCESRSDYGYTTYTYDCDLGIGYKETLKVFILGLNYKF